MKLFIDSATNYLYLAIVNNDIVHTFSRSGKNDHSETLVYYLENFLKEHMISVEDIKEVYVGRGPGSYTGLRIAGTVAKVYAFIKNLPLYSFSSLDLLFARYIEQDGKYKVSLRANEYVDVSVVASKFAGGGHVRAAGFESVMTMEQIKMAILEEVRKQL